jgi:hypothetical protein
MLFSIEFVDPEHDKYAPEFIVIVDPPIDPLVINNLLLIVIPPLKLGEPPDIVNCEFKLRVTDPEKIGEFVVIEELPLPPKVITPLKLVEEDIVI